MAKVTSKIASLPSQRQQMETRFVELMTELFQLDEAEALDFGLYRVIRRHNREVKAFLGEIISENESKALQGGRLAELLNAAFEAIGHEAQAEDKFRLKDLEDQLGLKPGMTQDQREVILAQAENIPAAKGLVAEYRSRTETLGQQQTVQQDRAEVLNRLYQFFSRHYQDGDFIVERRYGKGGSRYVRSTGEDTEFHWATEDMYYIKSGDIFTDFPVRTDVVLDHVAGRRRVVIDTKFNSIVTRGWFREESVRSGYVYQIYAYLMSQSGSDDPLDQEACGLLLHPAIGLAVDETVVIQGHPIRFATIDLTTPASQIRKNLLGLIDGWPNASVN